MVATAIILAAGHAAVGTLANYVAERSIRKLEDIEFAEQRSQEREAEVEAGGPSFPTPIQHCLHPHHTIILTNTTPTPATKFCDACQKCIKAKKYYHCSENCDFDLHTECALSENMLENLTDKILLETFAHDHPLNMVFGKSKFICEHCKTQGNTNLRYSCKCCDKHFHLVCAVHPTRLRSFLHPEHELDLKVRPIYKKCAVCQIDGKSNTRAYCCKACAFYLHPECAQLSQQYRRSPLHKGHVLVFREVDHKSFVCETCGDNCKNWSYSCSLCEDFNTIHVECLLGSLGSKTNNNSSMFETELCDVVLKGLQKGVEQAVTGSVKSGIKFCHEQFR